MMVKMTKTVLLMIVMIKDEDDVTGSLVDLHSDSEGRELLSRSDLQQNLHLSVREHFEQMRLASFFD